VGARNTLRRGIVVLACAALAAAAAGRAAQAAPKPEPSPPAPAPIRPEAPPGPTAPQSAPTSGTASTPVQSTSPSPSVTWAPATHAAQTVSRPPVRKVERRARVVKKDPPPAPKAPSLPVQSLASSGGEFLETSAVSLAKSPSDSERLLLLLVGLALVVLVLGETTFLRMAARAPKPHGTRDEPLPIRRVQLRR
jgi:hypothetical protein